MAKKICFVVQRYGLEVNGGAELHARQLAERMLEKYSEVHVLTTKAVDYMSWKNEYEEDIEGINGVIVHRFPVEHERDIDVFNEINGEFLSGRMEPSREMEWIEKQGPYVPRLTQYLKDHEDEYDAFIFFTYLYYPTVMGVKEVAERAVIIPTTHDEPFLKMSIYDDVFTAPQGILFNTDEEKELVQKRYDNARIPHRVGAAGIEVPDDVDPQRFKEKYDLDDFVIYVGRIDEGKNCPKLFDYFTRYKQRNPSDLKLVLLGKEVIKVPEHEDIIPIGFVDDADKFDGMAAAKALILPSKFESLSFVVIESMLVRTPVLVNGECDVLRGHCIKSNGALYYIDYLEFESELNLILNDPALAHALCDNAFRYAKDDYTWERAVSNLSELIEGIR